MDSSRIQAPPSAEQLATHVRSALAEHYARPIVDARVDGTVAVVAGRAIDRARAAVEAAWGADEVARIVELDVVALPWHAVAAAGLRLWRQHGRSGSDGEIVTELEAGDPPFQVVTTDDGWQLVRLADGAQGWIEAQDHAPAAAPTDTLSDASRVDVEAFLEQLLSFEGVPYVWGGTTNAGVDCSGIVQRAAWRAGGCWLPRHSKALLTSGRRVAPSAIERGDVLVLKRDPKTQDAEQRAQLAALAEAEARTGIVPPHGPAIHPLHVAVALSADEAIHASRDTMRVAREPLESLRARYRVLGVRRLGPPEEPA
ncbi:MAG: hypothetical protein JWM90_1658 [Thermoleophilia bacterium]|nr:hypothetical protein [Thermoleophilia bacterium]